MPTWFHIIFFILLAGQQPHLFSTMSGHNLGRVHPSAVTALELSLQQLEYVCIFF